MSVSIVQRLFAFFDNVWSFILTLVRSLLALFSFRRRASDPFTLPRVNRAPKEALARAHAHLRPILLTPRSVTYQPQRAQSTRSRSATSTLVPAHNENALASGSTSQPIDPQRTSPKLDSPDPELGLSVAPSVAGTTGTASLPEGTFDTSTRTTATGLSSASPLTPPDRSYLDPMPSTTDCPYTESWPTVTNKPRLPGSPLKVSINAEATFHESVVRPMGSGRWSPVQVWTSTPCKDDDPVPVPDSALSATESSVDTSSALVNISHALISRSRSSILPYDDTSNSSRSPDVSSVVDHLMESVPGTLQQPGPLCVRRAQERTYPQSSHPDAYPCTWRRHGTRFPGKHNRTSQRNSYVRSYSHLDLPATQWYNADIYVPSPISELSPPRGDSATEDEDEEEIPLNCLKSRLVRRSAVIEARISLNNVGIPSQRTRRLSDGCLLAMSQATPTPVGVSARSSKHVISLALDGDENDSNDWLEALSLRFSSGQREAPAPGPQDLPKFVDETVD